MRKNAFIYILVAVGLVAVVGNGLSAQGETGPTTITVAVGPVGNFTPILEVVLENETVSFAPTDDTYIANLDPSEVNGDLEVLATRNRYGNGGSPIWECNVLIRFDLSSLPPSIPISSASLNLYYYDFGDTNPSGRPLTAYAVTSDWHEMSVNYNTRPTTAANVSATATVPGSIQAWVSWPVTEDVQAYVNAPETNFGWEIRDETYWGYYWVPAAYFASKEYVPPTPPEPSFVPYLEVQVGETVTKCYATDDTYIANYDPSEINGDLEILAARNRYGAGSDIWECDVLVRFDLAAIPQSTQITAASLHLYYSSFGDVNPAGRPLTAYRVTSDWDENRVNYNRRPSTAGTMSASATVPSSAGRGMVWDVTADVQQFVNTPSMNYGWMIMDETYWGDFNVPVAYFQSKETGSSLFVTALLVGSIANKTIDGDLITVEATSVRVVYFDPFDLYSFSSHETIVMQQAHLGWIGPRSIVALCRVLPIY